MPMIDVELVVGEGADERLPQNGVQDLADGLAAALGSGPADLWLRLRYLPESQYAENERPEPIYPVFVTVLKAHIPGTEELADEMERIAEEVAAHLGRAPENVHVLYSPGALGRIGFGGVLARGARGVLDDSPEPGE